MQKVQQTYLRHQQELSSKEQEATGKIFERMTRIIGKIAASENFTMISTTSRRWCSRSRTWISPTSSSAATTRARGRRRAARRGAGAPSAAKK